MWYRKEGPRNASRIPLARRTKKDIINSLEFTITSQFTTQKTFVLSCAKYLAIKKRERKAMRKVKPIDNAGRDKLMHELKFFSNFLYVTFWFHYDMTQ